MKYQIETGGKKSGIERKGDAFTFNDEPVKLDFHSMTSDTSVVGIGGEMFTVRLMEISEDKKKITALVNGKKAELNIQSETDLLLEKMGVAGASQVSAKKIKAPMPGLIVRVLVEIGEEVEKGQVLLNFEAMKMENQLKSPGSGKIKSISVGKGDKVEKGQVLVEMV
jgi:biotin carboxyl carrier protein